MRNCQKISLYTSCIKVVYSYNLSPMSSLQSCSSRSQLQNPAIPIYLLNADTMAAVLEHFTAEDFARFSNSCRFGLSFRNIMVRILRTKTERIFQDLFKARPELRQEPLQTQILTAIRTFEWGDSRKLALIRRSCRQLWFPTIHKVRDFEFIYSLFEWWIKASQTPLAKSIFYSKIVGRAFDELELQQNLEEYSLNERAKYFFLDSLIRTCVVLNYLENERHLEMMGLAFAQMIPRCLRTRSLMGIAHSLCNLGRYDEALVFATQELGSNSRPRDHIYVCVSLSLRYWVYPSNKKKSMMIASQISDAKLKKKVLEKIKANFFQRIFLTLQEKISS